MGATAENVVSGVEDFIEAKMTKAEIIQFKTATT